MQSGRYYYSSSSSSSAVQDDVDGAVAVEALLFSALSCDSLASTQSSCTVLSEDGDGDGCLSSSALLSVDEISAGSVAFQHRGVRATHVIRLREGRGRLCAVEGCQNERRTGRAKYCLVHKYARPDSTMQRASRLHIARLVEAGVVDDDKARAVYAQRQCKNNDGRFAFRRGVCRACYARRHVQQSNLPDESLSLS